MKRTVIGAAALLLAASFVRAAEPPACDLFGTGGFFVGCNYWAKHAGMYMWSDWRPDVVEQEFAALAAHGATVLRVFPLWSDFQPLTGDCRGRGTYRSYRFRDNRPLPNEAGVDDEMVRRFAWFCDCAERHGIRFVVGIVTGWMSGRQFAPSVFEEKDVLTDPEAVMWQTKFVKYFVEALKGKKAIAAWDLGNECACMGGKTTAEVYNWINHIAMTIRLADPSRPVVSGIELLSTKEDARVPIRRHAELLDVFTTHPYTHYTPGGGKEPFDTMRDELLPTAQSLLWHDLGGKPTFIEEMGNLGTSCNSEARTAAGVRAMLFSAWANDLKGFLWWCNADQEHLEFPPYELTPYERELGLLRPDGTPKPVMLEMRDFQKFRASLPFARLPRRTTDAVIVVSEKEDGWRPAFGAYLLCRQAGIDPVFAGAEHDLPDAPLYVFTSANDLLAFTYPAQKRVFEKARLGATVLALYGAYSRYTHLRELTGLEADYGILSPCRRTFALATAPDRPMTCDDVWTSRLVAREAETLATTTDGEPAFTRFSLGKGQVLVVNSPVDRAAVDRSDVLTGEKPMSYYLLFREAAARAGLRRTVEKGDCPAVGISVHPFGDGRAFAIAVNYEPRAVTCPIRLNGRLGAVWRGEVTQETVRLAPNEAAVFEVRTSAASRIE